jgi:hypothetical protein
MSNTSFRFVSLLMLAIAGCKSTETPAPGSGLEGTWRLTNRQCYCVPAPVPDETITFTATRFTFFSGNRATRLGDYTIATAAVPCINNGTTGPALLLTDSNATTIPGPPTIQYRLTGDTLTLDYGGPCDAPVDTYERL